ncbi:uncharacterized protein A1O9_01635 [Exophiala aquamarina CBS 119918]|uniref:Conserved oligomeric Golgi complex subunit 2 n=1 Tax=Exophiala aquamarina CBS 119918 TaxID=1182545 RepID=A0A072PV81_9EURO|nr:uncharacterized protein A1O9_01635 [Exophiala aquamarina CBS 119918]KEF63657.1 hypothetical protein A1O9_01635 [Exophiala aquamarina CBS 119918]
MSSRFYFGASDSGSDLSDADNDSSTLPFPKPLDRSAFLAPDFDATAFLSSLSHRFQTLEDLQSELRELSQTLNKELVDLVNDNYHDFLSLGATLSGGEEKIEEIRVGLLGFQRDVKSVRDRVDERREEARLLLQKKRALRQETGVGRALLEIAERLDELEEKMGVARNRQLPLTADPEKIHAQVTGEWSDAWIEAAAPINSSDEDYDDGNTANDDGRIPPRLKRRTEQFLILKHLVGRHGPQHPFILAQDARMRKIQELLLSDVENAIKREPDIKYKQQLLQIRAAVEG